MRWCGWARREHARCVIEVRRLRADEVVLDKVFERHWLEWGVQAPGADAVERRAQIKSRCEQDRIPFTLVAFLDGRTARPLDPLAHAVTR